MSDPLTEILSTWPGRWSYPALARALELPEEVDDARAGRLLLEGLAEPLTMAEGIDRLIDGGDYALCDAVLGGSDPVWQEIPADHRKELGRRLAEARQESITTADRKWVALAERARRAGLEPAPPEDRGRLLESAAKSRGEADLLLAVEEGRVATAEQLLADSLRADLPDDGDPAFVKAVLACIDAGEYPAARALLEAGRVEDEGGGPASVPRPPIWEGSRRSLEEILLAYPPHQAPQWAARFTGISDSGEDVVEALRHLTAHQDVSTVGAFAAALSRVLGEDVRPPVTESAAGFRTTLLGLADARLPSLLVTRRTGMMLWVSQVPPPEESTEPVLWFVPSAEETSSRPGVAVMTAIDLLCLLAPAVRNRPPTAPTVRINLLRLVVPQLDLRWIVDPATGVDLAAGQSPRDALAWFLDLCGISADAAALDALMYESGGLPRAVHLLLDRLLREPHRGRLTVKVLDAVRTPEFRAALLAELTEEASPEERALLGMAYALHTEEPVTQTELVEDVPLFGLPADVSARIGPLLGADEVMRGLVRAGLLTTDGTRFAVLRSGPGSLLAAASVDLATQALREVADRSEAAQNHAMTILTHQAIEHLGHRADNQASGLLTELDLLEETEDPAEQAKIRDRIRRRVHEMSGSRVREVLPEIQRPAEHCDLRTVLKDLARAVGFSESVDIKFRCAEKEPITVFAHRKLIEIAIENLLVNAAQAVRPEADEDTLIMLRLHTADQGSDGAEGAWCVIDVEDTGPGLTKEELSILTSGGHYSRNGTGGSGLNTTRQFVRQYGGTLEILPGSATFGGAHLRVWLPRS